MSIAPRGRIKTVHWTITSKIDPRWNSSGKSGGFITILPHDVNKHLKKCKKEYGKQPKDLVYETEKEIIKMPSEMGKMKLDTLKQIKGLSEDISTSLNQIFNCCIVLKDGIDTSTLNRLEKIGITKIINTIYDNCGGIRSTRQTIYDLANSNMKK